MFFLVRKIRIEKVGNDIRQIPLTHLHTNSPSIFLPYPKSIHELLPFSKIPNIRYLNNQKVAHIPLITGELSSFQNNSLFEHFEYIYFCNHGIYYSEKFQNLLHKKD